MILQYHHSSELIKFTVLDILGSIFVSSKASYLNIYLHCKTQSGNKAAHYIF
jgi:hypothetical protein